MLLSIVLCKFVEARKVDMEIMAVETIIQIDWNNPRTPYTVRYLFLLIKIKIFLSILTSNYAENNYVPIYSSKFIVPDVYICAS